MAPAKSNAAPKKASKKTAEKHPSKAEPVSEQDVPAAAAVAVTGVDVSSSDNPDQAGPSSGTASNDITNRVTTAQPTFANLSDQYLVLVRRIEKDLRDVRALGKKLQQVHNKEVKQLQSAVKSGGRRRKNVLKDPNAPKRTPKGIAAPTPLSSELAAFLKVEPDTWLARTEVIKRLNAYIKENDLQNPKDKRLIIPDTALERLIKKPEDFTKDVGYFNLQSLLKHHYPSKAAKQEVAI